MPFPATCPECRTTFQLKDSARGKIVRCSRCKTVFTAHGNDSSALTPTLAETKAPMPRTARNEKPWVALAVDGDTSAEQKIKKSMLPYWLIGGGLLLLLIVIGGSIGGYVVWKEMVRAEREAEAQAQERMRRAQEANRILQGDLENHRIPNEVEKRIAEDLQKMERDRQEHFKRFQEAIEEHRRIREQFRKMIPPNFPPDIGKPPAPERPAEVVQAPSRSILLQAKSVHVLAVLWTGAASKQTVIVRMTDQAIRLDQYDLTSGRKLGGMDTPLQFFTSTVRDVSPDGKYYLSNQIHSGYTIWALPNPKPIVDNWQPPAIGRQGAGSAGGKVAGAYLLNGPRLLIVNDAGQVAVWSIPKAAGAKPALHKSYVPKETVARYSAALDAKGIALGPDRKHLAVFNGSDGFFLLDTSMLELQGVVRSSQDALPAGEADRALFGVAFRPDGHRLAAVFHPQSFRRRDAQPRYPQLICWDLQTKRRTARFDDLSKGSGGPGSRVGWWGNEHVWVGSAAHPGSLLSLAKQRVVLRATVRPDEIYFGSPDGKCWLLTADPDGNIALKSIDLPAAALQRADPPLSLTANGIMR